jgi:hypothetical protein
MLQRLRLRHPVASLQSISNPTTLTFPYDRHAVSNYAIEHSYDTAVNHGSLQSNRRVTQRIITSVSVPYAYFHYNGIGQQGVTGSAVFVSESLWMGGMPMIIGDSDSCQTAGGENKGWRSAACYPDGCPDPGLSGQARSTWMNQTMRDLFNEFNW